MEREQNISVNRGQRIAIGFAKAFFVTNVILAGLIGHYNGKELAASQAQEEIALIDNNQEAMETINKVEADARDTKEHLEYALIVELGATGLGLAGGILVRERRREQEVVEA